MEVRVSKSALLAIVLIILGTTLRILPHTANFAPIGAIALFGGAILGWRTALWLPLTAMVISDLIIGFYPSIFFTWVAFLLIVPVGISLRNRSNLFRCTIGPVGSALVFFAVSNFGVWLEGRLYPHTWQGFVDCYAMALPFLRPTFLSDLSFSVIFFGLFALLSPNLKGHFTYKLKTTQTASN